MDREVIVVDTEELLEGEIIRTQEELLEEEIVPTQEVDHEDEEITITEDLILQNSRFFSKGTRSD